MNAHTQLVQKLLRYTFGVVAVVAGLDKFFNILVDWSMYLAPFIRDAGGVTTIMLLVGIIEILVGLALLFGSKRIVQLFAYVLSVWLLIAAFNLITTGYLDIAVRDIVMAIAAFSLARLTTVSTEKEKSPQQEPLSV